MLWIQLLITFCGCVGGLVNAFFSDAGFKLPSWESVNGVKTVWKPGWIGNVLVGLLTAWVSWALYGPYAGYVILGGPPAPQPTAVLTLAALAMAVLAGLGGGRLLSSWVDKELLRQAAALVVMKKGGTQQDAIMIASARPAQALEIARSLS